MLGGTGAMGNHLSNILSMNGHTVYVTTRGARERKGRIQYIQGNAQNELFLTQLLSQSWDVIVDFMVYSTSHFEQRIESLLNATGQYIFLSSARVYANSEIPITENSPRLLDISDDQEFLSSDEYALSKARQENLLFSSAKKNWTIIRPYITYSEERLQLGVLEKEAWLYRAIHHRPIAFCAEMSNKITTLTYGLDVSNGIAALIGQDRALGEAFHITSDETLSWEQVLNIYIKVLDEKLGNSPTVTKQSFNDFTKWHTASYQVKYDRFYNRIFDNSKINEFVDTSDFMSPVLGLESCLTTFLNSPEFLSINWRLEAIKDRQQKVLTPLAELPNFKQKIKYLLYRFR